MMTSYLETWIALRWVNNVGYLGIFKVKNLTRMSKIEINKLMEKVICGLKEFSFNNDNTVFLAFFKSPSDTCAPYQYDSNDKPIVPCGSITNSMFNGTWGNLKMVNSEWSLITVLRVINSCVFGRHLQAASDREWCEESGALWWKRDCLVDRLQHQIQKPNCYTAEERVQWYFLCFNLL